MATATDDDLDQDLGKAAGEGEGKNLDGGAQDDGKGKNLDDASLNSNADDNHDEDHNDDTGISADATEAEREEIRKRRKEERNRKREAQREREESLRRKLAAQDSELRETRERLAAIERRTQQADIGSVDTEIRKTSEAYNYYKGQIELSVKNGDGAAVAEATEKMIMAQRRAEQLVNLKNAAEKGQERTQPLDAQVVRLGNAWREKHSWYNPEAARPGTDTRIALQVDHEVFEDGFKPNSQEYWDELDARLKKYLPHRYNSGHNSDNSRERTQNKSPVAGSGREGGGGSGTGKSFTLSAERKAALQDAGLWNDPKAREAAIARFRKYDAEQSKGAQQ